ncbi:isochorismatase family cysteine hydrolase [Streptomyces sp. NPDC085927]|uniref:isochorismatase family cysteine hydrolase n=1 Tax=Streptomyces sp. NPDC085927 TaxID=3365738 RepID=UPI0037D6880D
MNWQRGVQKRPDAGPAPLPGFPLTGILLGLDRPYALRFLPHADSDWHRPGPAEVRGQMGRCPDEVLIRKPSYGAFYDTPLDTMLRNLDRDTVIVTGTLTNYCCGTTARQAYERGYTVVFGSDVTATDDESRQEPELAVLRKGFALMMTVEEITNRLTAATPASDDEERAHVA